MIRYAIVAGFSFWLGLSASDLWAQDNYVLCESPVTGAQSVFPGTSCPSGWIFISIVQ